MVNHDRIQMTFSTGIHLTASFGSKILSASIVTGAYHLRSHRSASCIQSLNRLEDQAGFTDPGEAIRFMEKIRFSSSLTGSTATWSFAFRIFSTT
jgi:hypothetical protein